MSFKIGDIVTPKPGYVGNGYRFKIIDKTMFPFEDTKYILERVEDLFDPLYGPFEYQMNKLKSVERMNWTEFELDEAYKYNPKPYEYGKQNDAVDSLTYATQVMGLPINQVKITGDSIQAHIPTPDKPQEIKNKNLFDCGIVTNNGLTITKDCASTWTKATDYVPYEIKRIPIKIDKINEEEINMNILDLYKERKEKEIQKEFREKRQEIMEQDTIQSIIIEMQDQVNAILESEDLKGRLKVYEPELHTKETEEKLEQLRLDTDKKEQELRSTLDEIRALFEMTEDYNERIKILKNYKIINKDGKLSV